MFATVRAESELAANGGKIIVVRKLGTVLVAFLPARVLVWLLLHHGVNDCAFLAHLHPLRQEFEPVRHKRLHEIKITSFVTSSIPFSARAYLIESHSSRDIR